MRKLFWLICIVVLAFCVWLLFYHRTEPLGNSSPHEVMMPTNQQLPSQPKQVQVAGKSTSNASVATPARMPRPPITTNEIRERILADWQKPINFYGKVIDENSNAVGNVNISFQWSGFSDEQFTAVTNSDASGLFSLQGKTGHILGVSIHKEGYYNSHKDKSDFQYSIGPDIYTPEEWNPVVFHLQKKGQGESLIEKDFPPGIGQIWQLHHDGTQIELDLLNGSQNVAGGGQLKLKYWRDISDLKKQPFDWKLQVSIPSGGLIGTDEEFAFQAPESEYLPSIIIDMPATNQVWLTELRTKYYIQQQNGDYGRFDFYLLPRNGVFTVHSVINPTGSRNLEPK
jgi:hypothetical protein